MRLIKMLGLAMVAAIAAMAFLGTAGASADTACAIENYPGETCPEANRYTGEVKAELEAGTEAILESSALTVKCKKSTVTGNVETNGGAEIEGKITGVTFTECSGCSPVEATELPWAATANFLEYNSEANQQQENFTAKNIKVVMKNCLGFVTCTVTGSATLSMHSTGPNGSPAKKTWFVANVTLTVSGTFCPVTGTWKATYVMTTPSFTWGKYLWTTPKP